MVEKLVKMYLDGAITGYQAVVDCLHILDPGDPDAVLSHLPDEVLREMWEYTLRYDPSRMRSHAEIIPTVDQVKAAQDWITQHQRQQSEQKLASLPK